MRGPRRCAPGPSFAPWARGGRASARARRLQHVDGVGARVPRGCAGAGDAGAGVVRAAGAFGSRRRAGSGRGGGMFQEAGHDMPRAFCNSAPEKPVEARRWCTRSRPRRQLYKLSHFAEGFDIALANLGTLLKVFGEAQCIPEISTTLTCGFYDAQTSATHCQPKNLQQSAEFCRAIAKTFSKVPSFSRGQLAAEETKYTQRVVGPGTPSTGI